MVKTGCSCQNSSIRTMLDHSWPNGTVDLQHIQPLSPLRHRNSLKQNQRYLKFKPLVRALGLTEHCAHGLVKKKNRWLGNVLLKHDSNSLLSKKKIQTIQVLRLHGNRCTLQKEAIGSGGMVLTKTVAMMRTGTSCSRYISQTSIERSISIYLHTFRICGPTQQFLRQRHHRSLNR